MVKVREEQIVKVKIDFRDSLKDRSTKVKGPPEQPRTSLKAPLKSNSDCCVCGANFYDDENVEDCFRCVERHSWACENCFNVTKSLNREYKGNH